jgi:hypothetical protein
MLQKIMKKVHELTIGVIIFLLLDRFARAISTTVAEGSDEKQIHKVQIRIELLIFVVTLLIAARLWL